MSKSATSNQLDAFADLDRNQRYTPTKVFNPLAAEFRFTLDVCATRESAKCKRYFTRADDGLRKSWKGERVFCNPPWDEIDVWLKKAWLEEDKAELIVMLLPSWTDRKWWHEHVEPFRDKETNLLKTRFLPGRIRFGKPGDPEGENSGQPNFWCVLLVWGNP